MVEKDTMLNELSIRVGYLEKMLDKALSAIATAAVAEKTADKALAMAQEALVVITSGERASLPNDTPLHTARRVDDKFDFDDQQQNEERVLKESNLKVTTDDFFS